MDEEYLSKYEELKVDSEIPLQKEFSEVKSLTEKYPIAENEEERENTYLSFNRVVGTAWMQNCVQLLKFWTMRC